jgi:hypothetical protein
MRARRLYMLMGEHPDAPMYVNIAGKHVPIVSARYEPQPNRQYILMLDGFELLRALEQQKSGPDEEHPQSDADRA